MKTRYSLIGACAVAAALCMAAAGCDGNGNGGEDAADGIDSVDMVGDSMDGVDVVDGTDVPPDVTEAGDTTDVTGDCSEHCNNGILDCGEEYIDCGGECGECTGNRASFVSQDVPAAVFPGSRFNVEITMRNHGTTTWSPEAPNAYRLGSWNPQDNDTWGTGRINMAADTTAAPDSDTTFTATLTAPAEAGEYDFQWRMVHELMEWFGEPSGNLRITVEGPPQYETNPFTFSINQPVPDGDGGFFVHDLDGDGLLDFVVTDGGNVGAYDHFGTELWVVSPGIKTSGQYPGLHHPGAIAGDMDGDTVQEVGYITPGEQLRILDALTGAEEASHDAEGAEGVSIANLRGEGDRDAILQYDATHLKAIRLDTGAQIWDTTEYICIEHSLHRQADLDNDGLDEVAGLVFIDDNGTVMSTWDLRDRGTNMWNVDSIVIADAVAGWPLEAALAEQGGNNEALLVNHEQIYFGANNPDNPCCEVADECRERDPDKVAVGNFSAEHDGLEIFCRSACGRAPWMFSNSGEKIAQWVVDDTKPESWYIDGIEEICRIDWDGDGLDEAVAKERHVLEDGGIFQPMTGAFLHVFTAAAQRIYAVDISGDGREEVVILDAGGEIRVYWNEEPSLGDSSVSPWTMQHYRRQKQNWNYYSP